MNTFLNGCCKLGLVVAVCLFPLPAMSHPGREHSTLPAGKYEVNKGTDSASWAAPRDWDHHGLNMYFSGLQDSIKAIIAQMPRDKKSPEGKVKVSELIRGVYKELPQLVAIEIGKDSVVYKHPPKLVLTARLKFQHILVDISHTENPDRNQMRKYHSHSRGDGKEIQLAAGENNRNIAYIVQLSDLVLGKNVFEIKVVDPENKKELGSLPLTVEAVEPAYVKVRLTDAETKQLTPARAGLYSDGLFQPALDALPVYPYDRTQKYMLFNDLVWPGPQDVPRPRENAFYTRGEFEALVRPGEVLLCVKKGIEYRLHQERFTLKPGQRKEVSVTLERFADLPAEGWYSADDHVHITRKTPERNQDILDFGQAEDLHVMNILEMGNIETEEYFKQYAWRDEGTFQQGEYLLRPGQECPRTPERGHVIIINNATRIWDPNTYYVFEDTYDEAHRQGALFGYAHWGAEFFATRALALSIPLGKCDFIELHQPKAWKKALALNKGNVVDCWNLGFKQTLTGGSDFPFGSDYGRNRFFVYVEGDFSFDAWFEGLKQGRTYVSNGPILDFTVDGKRSGAEITLTEPKVLKVRLRARMNPTLDRLKTLSLTALGEEIAVLNLSGKKDTGETVLEYELKADKSLWIAASAAGEDSFAETTPVYVTLNGEPFWKEDGLAQLLDKMETRLGELEGLIDEGVIPANQGKTLKTYIRMARERYQDMRTRAGKVEK